MDYTFVDTLTVRKDAAFIDDLLEVDFAVANVARWKGEDVTLSALRENGFRVPLLIPEVAGLGLHVPPGLTVAKVVDLVGGDTLIPVLDVSTQEGRSMSMKDWGVYFCEDTAAERAAKGRLNVISLEVSQTALGSLVTTPRVVREMDWIEVAWKQRGGDCATKFPHVQLYCLMGVAGSYTDFHIDFGGTSVWYHIVDGEKWFYMIPPTSRNLKIYQDWSSSQSQNAVFLPNLVGLDQVRLVKFTTGMTMFIPTGWIHAVYTPRDTLVFGGNFLHGLAMGLQLKVYQIEKKSGVKKQFTFPYYERMMFYALEYYVKLLQHGGAKPLQTGADEGEEEKDDEGEEEKDAESPSEEEESESTSSSEEEESESASSSEEDSSSEEEDSSGDEQERAEARRRQRSEQAKRRAARKLREQEDLVRRLHSKPVWDKGMDSHGRSIWSNYLYAGWGPDYDDDFNSWMSTRKVLWASQRHVRKKTLHTQSTVSGDQVGMNAEWLGFPQVPRSLEEIGDWIQHRKNWWRKHYLIRHLKRKKHAAARDVLPGTDARTEKKREKPKRERTATEIALQRSLKDSVARLGKEFPSMSKKDLRVLARKEWKELSADKRQALVDQAVAEGYLSPESAKAARLLRAKTARENHVSMEPNVDIKLEPNMPTTADAPPSRSTRKGATVDLPKLLGQTGINKACDALDNPSILSLWELESLIEFGHEISSNWKIPGNRSQVNKIEEQLESIPDLVAQKLWMYDAELILTS